MSPPPDPLLVSAAVFGLYILTYSTYDKTLRGFNVVEKLKDIFLFRVSFMWTIREFNKVAGLTALTLTGLAILANNFSVSLSTFLSARTLLTYGINIGRLHGIFSMIEYRRRYSDSAYSVAMVLGSCAFFATFLLDPVALPQVPVVDAFFAQIGAFGSSNWILSCLLFIGLALVHTLAMERSKTSTWGFLKPQMRPAGLASLFVAGAAAAVLAARLFSISF